MKNDFEIRGEVTAIFLKRKDGTVMEALIDTADLQRVQEFRNTWFAHFDRNTKGFYVDGKLQAGGKRVTVKLHRWILKPPDHLDVDHINHDTLDNRRSNLRLVTKGQNNQNRRSGKFRGAQWEKTRQKWRARARLNGKMFHFGYFETKEDAAAAAAKFREKHMPYSKDAIGKNK